MSESTEPIADSDAPSHVTSTPVHTDASEVAKAESPASDVGPRLIPAAVIVAMMWILILVPGKLFPATIIHFMTMQFAPMVAAISLAILWLSSNRVPWRERWKGLLLIVCSGLGAVFAVHPSVKLVLLVYGLPLALTIAVGLAWWYQSTPWHARRWIAFGGYASVLVALLMVRVGEMDADFAFNLVPRWQPTAEEHFLASLDSDATPISASSFPNVTRLSAGDWAEFRGPRRDGRVMGVTFGTDWTAHPPKELWRRQIGPGWSSFCVVGPIAFTQEQRGEDELVTAYRVEDGEPIWESSIQARFDVSMGGVGPRATPTFRDGRLYVSGAAGLVQCLDASSGQSIWSYHLVDDLGVELPEWGFASSPLVTDTLVIVFAGGGDEKAVVALEKESGNLVWAGSDGTHGYCSPQLSQIDGVTQVLISSNKGLRSLQLSSGEILWKHDWDTGGAARVTQPLVVGNTVYLGTGYGFGTMRVDVSGSSGQWQVDGGWIAPMKPYFNDFVHYKGHLYGFDNSIFISVDGQSGERNWKGGRYGHGQVLLIEEMDMLLVMTEKGKLVLVRAIPNDHEEVAWMTALDGVTWNHPVIAGGRLLVRNSQEAACYQLPDFKQTAQ